MSYYKIQMLKPQTIVMVFGNRTSEGRVRLMRSQGRLSIQEGCFRNRRKRLWSTHLTNKEIVWKQLSANQEATSPLTTPSISLTTSFCILFQLIFHNGIPKALIHQIIAYFSHLFFTFLPKWDDFSCHYLESALPFVINLEKKYFFFHFLACC